MAEAYDDTTPTRNKKQEEKNCQVLGFHCSRETVTPRLTHSRSVGGPSQRFRCHGGDCHRHRDPIGTRRELGISRRGTKEASQKIPKPYFPIHPLPNIDPSSPRRRATPVSRPDPGTGERLYVSAAASPRPNPQKIQLRPARPRYIYYYRRAVSPGAGQP